MQLDKQELYQEIVSVIRKKAELESKSEELIASELEIPRSTWYSIKRYAKENGEKNILSPVRLKKVCLSIGILIKKEIYDIEKTN